MVVIYKILQWADKSCEGTIYRCDENNFFLQKYSPEASFCMQRERREEERRGRKVYILTSPSYGCG